MSLMLKISQSSRPFTRNANDKPFDRLILCVVQRLMEPDGDYISMYQRHRQTYADYVRGKVGTTPATNALQREISRLFPTASVCRLYFATRETPDRAISLRRIPNPRYTGLAGHEAEEPPYLWTLSSHYVTRNFSQPHRDGILLYWGAATPQADLACGITPQVLRLIKGGRASHHLALELSSNPELRRQLTFCIGTAALLQAQHTEEVSIFHAHTAGKVVLSFSPTDDPFFSPFSFTPIRVRPDDRVGTKRRCHIVCDIPEGEVSGLIPPAPRYLSIITKDLALHEFDASDEEMLLRELILGQLVPIVGVEHDDGDLVTVHVYGPHYDPSTQTLGLARYATRSPRGCASIPVIKRQGRRAWTPNDILVSIFRRYLLDPEPSARGGRHRSLAVQKILSTFIAPPVKGISLLTPEIMAELHSPFSEADIEAMNRKLEDPIG